MMVLNRFQVDEVDAAGFRAYLEAALAVLSAGAGYVDGQIGRNLDDPELWVLATTWVNVGSYRRALSSYDAKMSAVPLLSRAIDEPSAFETVSTGIPTNRQVPREVD
jgi:hypothetical protein